MLAVLVVLWIDVACGGRPTEAPVRHTAGKRVDPTTAATLTGRVLFSGTPPANPAIVMSSDAFCAHRSPGQPLDESVITGEGGALENVFVYVKDDLAAYTFDPPGEPARLEQEGCRFTPHVLGLRTGQTLELRNQDDTLHNVHAITRVNDDFNVGAIRGTVTRRSFTSPEVMIAFKCDVHGWMRAYAGVVAHPYFAVTAADGRFELQQLPPGDYVIAVWHERFGTQTARVTLGPKQKKEIGFTFSGT